MQHSQRDPQPPDIADPTPADQLGDTLGLLEDLVVINSMSAALLHRVEAVIGLRIGELQTLMAISEGADHPRTIASSTGQVTGAATATVEALIEQNLVAHHHHPAAPAGSEATLLHLTDRGTTALQQAEGVQIRILDALTTALGHRRTSDLRASIQSLPAVIDALATYPDPASPLPDVGGGHAQPEESTAAHGGAGSLVGTHTAGDRQRPAAQTPPGRTAAGSPRNQ